jgi:16S rRNA (adenine1518-N6/adenine1519-N6)-dimethyltransferase
MSKLPLAKKSLGQHFLVDQNVIRSITEDFSSQADIIIEVGPGPAILTIPLSKHKKPFYVVEKDTRFVEKLEGLVGKDCVFNIDALDFDWNSFLKQFKDKKIWLVSNLPYNVSVPLFLQFTKCPEIQFMTLMFQKEVGRKIMPLSDEKNSNSSLYMIGKNFFELKTLCKVAPGSFSPAPKVDSIVLSFERKIAPLVKLEEFNQLESFLREVFANKRKQIRGVLKKHSNIDQALMNCSIEKDARAESLSFEKILNLYQELK